MNAKILEALRSRGYVPRTLLDVGAHVGTFTQQFLTAFPGCRPTLIEPNPFCHDVLAQLGVEVHGVAASDAAGEAELFLTKEWLQSTGTSLYRENTRFFRGEMERRGFKILPGTHPICPIMLGDAALAGRMAEAMLSQGVYVVGFSYPVVPVGKARIRTQISAAHSREDLAAAIDAFTRVRTELGL